MDKKRTWGKSKNMYYCPKSKKVWQLKREGGYIIHDDMPTYGLERKELMWGK